MLLTVMSGCSAAKPSAATCCVSARAPYCTIEQACCVGASPQHRDADRAAEPAPGAQQPGAGLTEVPRTFRTAAPLRLGRLKGNGIGSFEERFLSGDLT